MKKKVTVIIPVYNCKEYLDECFKSVESQTIGKENIEVIIVNDGSTDGSKDIIEQYCKKNNWIVINQENHGLSYSRNVGIDNATTDFICFLDSDDYIAKNAIEVLYNNIINQNADIVVGKTIAFDSKGFYKYYTDKILEKNRMVTYNQERKIIEIVSACAKIYKKDILINNKFIVGIKHEDIYFTFKLFLNNTKVLLLNNDVYFRRYREGENKSIMQCLNYNTFKDIMFSYSKIVNECEIDFYFMKTMIKKINKYIAKNLSKNDFKEAQKECKEIVKECKKLNKLEVILLKIYRLIWMIISKIYICGVRRK